MLIKIDDSVVELIENDQNNGYQDLVFALENLATARREGKHAVIASSTTLKKLKDFHAISEASRGVYRQILESFSQIGDYTSLVDIYIELSLRQEAILENTHNKRILKVPPRFFVNTRNIQETILLCENLRDARWYRVIAEVVCKWKRIEGVKISFDSIGGGGTTIKDYYEKYQAEKNRFCICILDSDQDYSKGAMGGTALSVKNCHDSSCLLSHFVIINAREIENLIPIKVLEDLVQGNDKRSKALQFVESLNRSSSHEPRLFADLKKDKAVKNIIKGDCGLFWQKVLLDLMPNSIQEKCLQDLECNSVDNCICQIDSGFGENLLDSSIQWLDNNGNNFHKLSRMVEDAIKPEWERVGQEVFSWCFSLGAMRVY
jgi:hypothetical protein